MTPEERTLHIILWTSLAIGLSTLFGARFLIPLSPSILTPVIGLVLVVTSVIGLAAAAGLIRLRREKR